MAASRACCHEKQYANPLLRWRVRKSW